MAKKDKEQSKAFIDKARELGTDESGKQFERAFIKIAPPVRKPNRRGGADGKEIKHK